MAQLKDLLVAGAGRIIGKLYATSFKGDGAEITNINASNISSGTLSSDRLPSIPAGKISGQISSSNLPSYVDDVLEYTAKANFPTTGETGKIYVDTTTNLTYRWSGSAYVEISPSIALGQTSSTAYRGDRGKTAYDHSQATGNPHGTTIANISNLQSSLDAKVPTTRTVNNKALSANITLTASDVGAAASSHTHSYLPLSGGTLTGFATAQTSAATDIGFTAKNTDTNKSISLMVDSGKANRGVYDHVKGAWMLYADSNNNVILNGSATSATSATTATNATNLYSTASTNKAYLLGSATATTGNKATLVTGSVYTQNAALFGAAYNDYAEYRETKEEMEPGRIVCENGDGTLSLSTERLQPAANAMSDTFGFIIGETDKAKTPLAVSGRALVYTYRPRDEYEAGDVVCAAPNGTVDIMTRLEIREYPDRMVGIVSEIPDYDTWGENNTAVNGRIWIKVL